MCQSSDRPGSASARHTLQGTASRSRSPNFRHGKIIQSHGFLSHGGIPSHPLIVKPPCLSIDIGGIPKHFYNWCFTVTGGFQKVMGESLGIPNTVAGFGWFPWENPSVNGWWNGGTPMTKRNPPFLNPEKHGKLKQREKFVGMSPTSLTGFHEHHAPEKSTTDHGFVMFCQSKYKEYRVLSVCF